jgi:putative tricarboxylic transport membrane protein
MHTRVRNRSFVAIGTGVLVLAVLLGLGAAQIKGEAGYAGAGPNFLPWLLTALMGVCGVLLLLAGWGGREVVDAPDDPPRWVATAWVSAGLLLNALLIEHAGFILSCALLFALAARGFRVGADQRPSGVQLGRDFIGGLAVSAPVYWLFTKLLGPTLPGIVKGGWI